MYDTWISPMNLLKGYWSLGVIEHFWTGYDDILSEMYRVLTPGGLLVLNRSPAIALATGAKPHAGITLCSHPSPTITSPKVFINLAIPPRTIIKDLQKAGFTVSHHCGVDGLRGYSE